VELKAGKRRKGTQTEHKSPEKGGKQPKQTGGKAQQQSLGSDFPD